MLLDARSLDLVQHIDTVLAAVEGSDLEDQLHPELMQSVLEISTPVCRNIGDVDRELRHLRGAVTQVAPRPASASAPPARIRSASSSASGSPPATATGRSSTSSSTSHAAS